MQTYAVFYYTNNQLGAITHQGTIVYCLKNLQYLKEKYTEEKFIICLIQQVN